MLRFRSFEIFRQRPVELGLNNLLQLNKRHIGYQLKLFFNGHGILEHVD